MQTLGLYVTPSLSSRNLNLLYAVRLMAYILRDAVAEEFYEAQINYMLAINEFISEKEGNKLKSYADPSFTESLVQQFPALASWVVIPRLLLAWEDDASHDALSAFFLSDDPLLARLSKFIVSHNLLRRLAPSLALLVRGEIVASLAELPDEPEKEEETDVSFGTENHHREFKTSIVFPPESTGEADMERQLDVILRTIAGFLNADGGTLYIGVNDFGIPAGIQADLAYLHGSEDKYQLILRRRVVEHLGKDVNGLLEFRFARYGKRIVCAISVPPYHRAIPYKSAVWQRQGNATQHVQNTDLKLLKLRKKEMKILPRASTPLFPGEEGYDIRIAPASPVPPPPSPAPAPPPVI